MLTLGDIAAALNRYRGRYRFLDVFADDVVDLDAVGWVQQDSAFVTTATEFPLRVETLEGGVLRFGIANAAPSSLGPAILGAALGGAIGAATETKGAVVGGAILGMLVGALSGEVVQMNRVMALRFDGTAGQWSVYDGPLLNWAKERLAP